MSVSVIFAGTMSLAHDSTLFNTPIGLHLTKPPREYNLVTYTTCTVKLAVIMSVSDCVRVQ